jgi:hypothetical protein
MSEFKCTSTIDASGLRDMAREAAFSIGLDVVVCTFAVCVFLSGIRQAIDRLGRRP